MHQLPFVHVLDESWTRLVLTIFLWKLIDTYTLGWRVLKVYHLLSTDGESVLTANNLSMGTSPSEGSILIWLLLCGARVRMALSLHFVWWQWRSVLLLIVMIWVETTDYRHFDCHYAVWKLRLTALELVISLLQVCIARAIQVLVEDVLVKLARIGNLLTWVQWDDLGLGLAIV